jgi:hypothetical protein
MSLRLLFAAVSVAERGVPDPQRASPGRRRAVLAAAAALVALCQALFLPERVAFWKEIAAYARATPLERQERAFGRAPYELVERVRRETPANAVVLLVTPEPHPEGSAASVLYHRALVHLYPRRVIWATPASERRYPEWWIRTGLSPESLGVVARNAGATFVLARDLDAPPLPGATLRLDDRTTLTYLELAPAAPAEAR